jgi:tripartite-type tricarboxylate transporter receptor subunit TctC
MMARNISGEEVMHAMMRTLALFAALALAGSAAAQTYPNKPIKMIVTFAPAGPTDVIGRVIAQKVSESWGQQVVVENIAGAGGNIGVAAAARMPADGYTVVVVSTGYIINPSLYAKVPYEFKDFTPVSLVAQSPDVLSVNPAVPAKTVQELIALIKSNPSKYNYAQPGVGSTPHLSAELFKLKFALDLTMVPFGSAAPAITSTIAGHTPVAFTALPPAVANIQEGKLRGLAVLSAKRTPELADVPTMAEAGVPDLESNTLTGIVVPAGTPKDIIERWHREIVRIVALPEVNANLRTLGFDPIATSPEEYAERIKTEAAKWGKVAHDANIRID